jgi:hypothetical protein
MDLQQRINAFTQLGTFLSQFKRSEITRKEDIPHNELFFDGMIHQIKLASEHNGWFTKENVLYALEGWADLLTEKSLQSWLSNYTFPEESLQKTVAVIMAGNIPLVGFHDFLSIVISGHAFVGKQSSNDKHLLPFLAKYLEYVAPDFKGSLKFTEDKLPKHDAVIATGSDNTARYFEYYFGKKPNIIRKNRNSVAILTGNETPEELTALGEDVFRYYGLGCRNVSKLLVPTDYNFDAFFKAMYPWHEIVNQAKYANNYDYNKAVYLMSLFDLLENGFLMLKEDPSYGSPIATLFYERYSSVAELKEKLTMDTDKIQCVVSTQFGESLLERQTKEIPFGHTQKPQLDDYADGVDIIAFLLKI